MCLNPWQAVKHLLTQAGAKLGLVLVREVGAGAAGGDGCWVSPRAGGWEIQQVKPTIYLKMYQNVSQSS